MRMLVRVLRREATEPQLPHPCCGLVKQAWSSKQPQVARGIIEAVSALYSHALPSGLAITGEISDPFASYAIGAAFQGLLVSDHILSQIDHTARKR
ncbi:hypothetical protein BOSE127_80059 [Bosea sp. 127]|nr:hypothetical protein BOSE7B_41276 [Bosea sp. 7B]VXC92202.1 hypothetical protein BOSE127_80059 [Bosea sp. 127]